MAEETTSWYQCWHCNTPDCTQRIAARTRGKAKREFLDYISDPWPDIPYTEIRARKIGPITQAIEDPDFARTAEYRGVPFARLGGIIEVGGDRGRIVGKNSSANFDVLFESGQHKGFTLNCHPNWKAKYYDAAGNLLADFS